MAAPAPSAGPGLLGPADVRQLAAELGLRPTKRRGQNFVIDANTVRRIVATAGVSPGDHVLEVGPGLGSLTLGLLAAGARVTAVEIDPLLAAALPATVARFAPEGAERLSVVHADALVAGIDQEPQALVANLPYNVSVPVLLHLLQTLPSLRSALVMVQHEVGERLAAPPGSRVYGIPSVKLAWYASARIAGRVSRSVFWPAPHVDSALVEVVRRDPPAPDALRPRVFAVVDAAFSQRRKMVRSSLATLADPSRVDAALARAGVDPASRAERLAVADFARIADALWAAT